MSTKTRQECRARKAFLAFQSPSCQLYRLSQKLRINVLPWNERGGPPGSHFGSIFARGCVGQECLKGQWYAWNGTKNLDNAPAAADCPASWAWSAMCRLPAAQLGPFSPVLFSRAGGLVGPPGQLKVGPVRRWRRWARCKGAEVKRSGLLSEHWVNAVYTAAAALMAPAPALLAPIAPLVAARRTGGAVARAQCAGKSIRTLTALLTSPFLSWENFPVALCLLCMYFYVKVTKYVLHKYVLLHNLYIFFSGKLMEWVWRTFELPCAPLKPTVCTFLTPFFTSVYNLERLILHVLNKEILQKIRGL